MKFKVGDKVLVTGGKDKGKTSQIIAVLPAVNQVVVQDVNMYTRHMKPYAGRSGEKIRKERPMHTANVTILNEKNEQDRIGYKVLKTGEKVRVYKKTGTELPTAEKEEKVAKKK